MTLLFGIGLVLFPLSGKLGVRRSLQREKKEKGQVTEEKRI